MNVRIAPTLITLITITAVAVLAGCPADDGGKTVEPPAAVPKIVAPPATGPASESAAPVAPPVVPPAPAPAGVLSSDDTFWVTYVLDPDPIPLNETFDIRVRVYDGADRKTLVDDVELTVDGRMPQHRHGMNRAPRVERNADGSFNVTGMLFHMPGDWELHFDISRGSVTERCLVEVELE